MLANHPRTRIALYVASVVAAVVAPFVAVTSPEYGAAALSASGVLATAAGVSALMNLTKPADGKHEATP